MRATGPSRIFINLLLAGCLLLQSMAFAAGSAGDALPALMEPGKTASDTQVPTRAPLTGSVYQSEYVIGAGDSIYMEDETMGALVKDGKIVADGSINLPLVGKIFLAGLSVKQAKVRLADAYKKYFVNPRITLQITSQRPVRVYVQGAVNQPGIYISGKSMAPQDLSQIQLGSYDSLFWYYRMYLADALIMAGGLNYNADLRDIKIHRTFPKPVTIHVNLLELFENGDTVQDVPLTDQDVVEVNELPDNAIVMDDKWEEFARHNVNVGAFKISVLGAVTHPGAYQAKTSDSVLSAISMAGGFSEKAAKDKIFILRTTTSGQMVKRELNLADKTLIGSKSFDSWASLLPNDIVFIDESGARKVGEFGLSLVDKAGSAALYPLFSNFIVKTKKK